MTLDSRPVSLDALSAEDGAAVALAVSQAASENTAGPTANSGPPSPPGPPPRATRLSLPRTQPWPPT